MTGIVGGWKRLGTGSGMGAGLARLLIYALLLFLAFECITIDFRWPEQAVLDGARQPRGAAGRGLAQRDAAGRASLRLAHVLAARRCAPAATCS